MLSAEFIDRFVTALGDTRDYVYTGIINERQCADGACVCGHPIRYEFVIKNQNTGVTATIGSECIKHFKDYNPDMYDDLTSAADGFREKKRKEKDDALLPERKALEKTIEEYTETLKFIASLRADVSRYARLPKMSYSNTVRNETYIKKHKKLIEQFDQLFIHLNIGSAERHQYEEHCKVIEEKKQFLSKLLEDAYPVFVALETKSQWYEYNNERVSFMKAKRMLFDKPSRLAEPSLDNAIAAIEAAKSGALPAHGYYKVIATGDTFSVKEDLRKSGMVWDSEHKVWYKTGVDISEKNFPALQGIRYTVEEA
jgi:viroplasmin and RNaseH domain-containing protein